MTHPAAHVPGIDWASITSSIAAVISALIAFFTALIAFKSFSERNKLRKSENLDRYYKNWIADPALNTVLLFSKETRRILKEVAESLQVKVDANEPHQNIIDFLSNKVQSWNDEFYEMKASIEIGLGAWKDQLVALEVSKEMENMQDGITNYLYQCATQCKSIDGEKVVSESSANILRIIMHSDPGVNCT